MDFTYIVILVFIFVALQFFLRKSPGKTDFPYEKYRFLLTKAERNFYGTLSLALGDQFAVMCKVRIADVLGTRKGLSSKERIRAFNKISRKHFDFVLCEPADLSIVAAIELDDRSHRSSGRRERDQFVEGACVAAGLALHRFDVKRAYQVEELRKTIIGTPPEAED